ncbi:DUF6538 domain-containing protein [Thetidibacter halocola]|uniref:DUF6538 domain-containing protein n=1 Tax=Thetidibacter halocola TaxID=2827239 RepID=UPI0031FF1D29
MSEYKSAPFTFRKDGIFYFIRRIPADLRRHYSSDKISYSLRTKSSSVATARANQAACKLDEYWFHLRSQDAELPGKHLLRFGLGRSPTYPKADPVNAGISKLSEAVLTYLRLVNRHAILTPYRRPRMTPLERTGTRVLT